MTRMAKELNDKKKIKDSNVSVVSTSFKKYIYTGKVGSGERSNIFLKNILLDFEPMTHFL